MFTIRDYWFTALAACAVTGEAVSASPALSIGSTVGLPGTTVQVAVNYTTDTNAPSLQFDLLYSTNYLTNGTPVGGSALADQFVASSEPAPGDLRVLLFSLSNSPLTNGVLVYVLFTISSNSPDHDESLALSNVVVSSPLGTRIPAGASNGVLSIVLPPRFTAIFPTNNGAIHLELSGGTNRSYVIEAGTNLFPSQWVPITTNAAADGLVEFDDTSASGFALRFYRTVFQR